MEEDEDFTELDDIFFSCVDTVTQKAQASQLISHLVRLVSVVGTSPVGWPSEPENLEQELLDLFDPDKQDVLLDLIEFREKVANVLCRMNRRSEESRKCFTVSTDGKSCPPTTNREWSFSRSGVSPRKALFTRGGSIPDEIDSSYIEHTTNANNFGIYIDQSVSAESLKFQLKKMTEQNQELKDSLVSQEEVIARLTFKVEDLEKDNRSYQMQFEQKREILHENDELNLQIFQLMEARVELERENELLGRNITALKAENSDIETKFNELNKKFLEIKKEKDDIEFANNMFKKINMEIEQQEADNKQKLEMTEIELQEARSYLDAQRLKSETLKKEKLDLELQLNRTQHELQSIFNRTETFEVNSSVHLTPDELVIEEEEDEIDLGAVHLLAGSAVQTALPPFASSTPFKPESLCSELRRCIKDEPMLPSPLCEKEFEDVSTTAIRQQLDKCMRYLESLTRMKSSVKDIERIEFTKRSSQIKDCLFAFQDYIADLQETVSGFKTGTQELEGRLDTEKKKHAKEIQCEVNKRNELQDQLAKEMEIRTKSEEEANSLKVVLKTLQNLHEETQKKLMEAIRDKEELEQQRYSDTAERMLLQSQLDAATRELCERKEQIEFLQKSDKRRLYCECGAGDGKANTSEFPLLEISRVNQYLPACEGSLNYNTHNNNLLPTKESLERRNIVDVCGVCNVRGSSLNSAHLRSASCPDINAHAHVEGLCSLHSASQEWPGVHCSHRNSNSIATGTGDKSVKSQFPATFFQWRSPTGQLKGSNQIDLDRSDSSGSLEGLDLNMSQGVRYRTDSYEQAIGVQSRRKPSVRPLQLLHQTDDSTLAEDGHTTGTLMSMDSVHSNGQSSFDETMNHIKQAESILRPSTFRSGYYDLNNMRVPEENESSLRRGTSSNGPFLSPQYSTACCFPWHSRDSGLINTSSAITSCEAKSRRPNERHKPEPRFLYIQKRDQFVDTGVALDFRSNYGFGGRIWNYDDQIDYDDRSLSPASRRRLSVLKEESQQETSPVPPPRRRGRLPRPHMSGVVHSKARYAAEPGERASPPKYVKDMSNRRDQRLTVPPSGGGSRSISSTSSPVPSESSSEGGANDEVARITRAGLNSHSIAVAHGASLVSNGTVIEVHSPRRDVCDVGSKGSSPFSETKAPSRGQNPSTQVEEYCTLSVIATHKPPKTPPFSPKTRLCKPVFSCVMPIDFNDSSSAHITQHVSLPMSTDTTLLEVTNQLSQMTLVSPRAKKSNSEVTTSNAPPPTYKAPHSYIQSIAAQSRDSSPTGGQRIKSDEVQKMTDLETSRAGQCIATGNSHADHNQAPSVGKTSSTSTLRIVLNDASSRADTQAPLCGDNNTISDSEICQQVENISKQAGTPTDQVVTCNKTVQPIDNTCDSCPGTETETDRTRSLNTLDVISPSGHNLGSSPDNDHVLASLTYDPSVASISQQKPGENSKLDHSPSPTKADANGPQLQPVATGSTRSQKELRRAISFEEHASGEVTCGSSASTERNYSSSPTNSVPTRKSNAEEPPRKSSDGSLDIKQEILKGLEKTQDTSLKIIVKQPSELAKLREENIARKRLQKSVSGMPDLNENMEIDSGDSKTNSDISEHSTTGSPGNKLPTTPEASPTGSTTTAKKVESGKGGKGSDLVEAGLICESQVFPSLSNNVMKKLGLQRATAGEEPGTDVTKKMNDKEIEEKFYNVTLAFKTDRMTLDQRLVLHKRARDTIEQNIDSELNGLKEAMENLSPLCNDMKSRELYSLIQRHLEILEHSQGRLACRAEVHGAIQQEARISTALDVMVRHVENLKRLYEREHQELVESRRLLHENRLVADQSGSLSKGVSLGSAGGAKGTRRRASLAVLPRSLISPLTSLTPPTSTSPDKGRFQNLLDNTTSSVSSAFRRASLIARRASLGIAAGTSPLLPPLSPALRGDTPGCLSTSSPNLPSASSAVTTSTPGASSSVLPQFNPFPRAVQRMCSQTSSISSDDASTLSARLSLGAVIPEHASDEEGDIMHEVPIRPLTEADLLFSEGGKHLLVPMRTLTEGTVDPGHGTTGSELHHESHVHDSSQKCANSHGDCRRLEHKPPSPTTITSSSTTPSPAKPVSPENNNNNEELINAELEARKAREAARRAIANQTIITDDDPEEPEEEEAPAPDPQDSAMFQQALLFQEKLRGLLDRQDSQWQEEDEEEKKPFEPFLERLRQRVPDWPTLKLRMRYTLGGFLFLLGIFCLLSTFIPAGVSASGARVGVEQWDEWQRALWPFLKVNHIAPPLY